MKKINIFPKTVIQTNGVHPYVLKTVARDNSLKLIEIESKDDSAINVDLSDIVFNGVAIKAYSEIGETTLRWVRQCRATQNFVTVQNRPLECDDTLKVEYLSELKFLVSKGYEIQGVYLYDYELYYDAARWAEHIDTNSLSTDGKVETQTINYFYKYRLRRRDGQPIDPTLRANLGVYVQGYDVGEEYVQGEWVELDDGSKFALIEDTEYNRMFWLARIRESVTTSGIVDLSLQFNPNYEYPYPSSYSHLTGFLRVQIRDKRDDTVITEYKVLIDTTRQNVLASFTLSGPTSVTKGASAVYTILNKTWVNNNSHKYEDLAAGYRLDNGIPLGLVTISWIVPGESFSLAVSQDWPQPNVILSVYDHYHFDNGPREQLTVDVASGPSNLKFNPLHWTDVTSEWTLPADPSSALYGIGDNMWTDNQGNYYFGQNSNRPVYKIDFENKSITEMTGWTRRTGSQFWRIEDTVLDSYRIWNPDNTEIDAPAVNWNTYPTNIMYMWTDRTYIYYSIYADYDINYMLASFNPVTYEGHLGEVTFTHMPSSFDPRCIWTDGTDIYYSAGSTSQYVLDKATRDWGISAIDFSGYTLSSPRTRLFTDGIDIYMNTSTLTDNKLLKYDRNMMTFNVVANSYSYKSPNMMFSKYVVCPTCQCKGMLPALGNINPNTDDIYCIVGGRIYAMDKIDA